jgi:hypothetical protein
MKGLLLTVAGLVPLVLFGCGKGADDSSATRDRSAPAAAKREGDKGGSSGLTSWLWSSSRSRAKTEEGQQASAGGPERKPEPEAKADPGQKPEPEARPQPERKPEPEAKPERQPRQPAGQEMSLAKQQAQQNLLRAEQAFRQAQAFYDADYKRYEMERNMALQTNGRRGAMGIKPLVPTPPDRSLAMRLEASRQAYLEAKRVFDNTP